MLKILSRWKQAALITLCLITAAFSAVSYAEPTVVRVGWYDSPFNYVDVFGRRFGYAYDYQQKVAAYTGWTYEYVSGSWPDLYAMLLKGEIDLLSDVSFTPERAQQMLFASLPMGAESYYLFVSASNTSITNADIKTLNGKRIGVNAHSYQAELFKEWAVANGINAQLIEMTNFETEALNMVQNGQLDAYITMDNYEDANEHACFPIMKIGQSNFYFAVNKNRPELVNDLNYAMSKINDENRFYNTQLYNKYLQSSGTNAFISNEELKWIAQHGTIRVGYLDKNLPFCSSSLTGGLDGALKNYLDFAANSLKNATLHFDTKSYTTIQAATKALKDGEIDCIFPIHLSDYDAEKLDVMATNPFVEAEMYLLLKKADSGSISMDGNLIIALNESNSNYLTFLHDNFPNAKILNCKSFEECLNAVESSNADCTLITNYEAAKIQSENYEVYSLATGKAIDFAFAVRRSDNELYYILNKTASLVPRASIQAVLSEYANSGFKFSFADFLRANWYIIVIASVLLALLGVNYIRNNALRREKELKERLRIKEKQLENENKAHEIESMISAIAVDYRSIYYFDLEHDEGLCYRAKTISDDKLGDLEGIKHGERFPFSKKILEYADTYVEESYREGFLKFVTPENIRAKLANEIMTAHRYLTIRDGKEHYEMIRIVDINLNQNRDKRQINAVSLGFAEVDSETIELLKKTHTVSKKLENEKLATV